jgi:hypothetical protein
MRYLQCLLKNKSRYQLCWLPEKFAEKDNELKMQGDYTGTWQVKEVYTDTQEEIKECGKTIWWNWVKPLEGPDLEERLKLYKKLKKESQIEVINGLY